MEKITEQPSLYNDLEKKNVEELTFGLITEYKKIALAIEAAKPQLDKLLTAVVEKVKAGGRMIYLGAGTGEGFPCWMCWSCLLPSVWRMTPSVPCWPGG